MSHIFPRHTKQLPPTAVRGSGCYLYDETGKEYLDASGGAAVSCLGHGDQALIDAVKAQLDSLAYAHTGFFTSEPAEKLADILIAHAPEGLDRVYLVSGGSEAMEAALKLARQYFVEKGEPNRGRVIARKQSYHGNTMGALSAGGNAWRRAQFGPLLIDMSHIDPCYEYRLRKEGESLDDYGIRAANLLEEELLRVGPETVMAFAAEPVVGATAVRSQRRRLTSSGSARSVTNTAFCLFWTKSCAGWGARAVCLPVIKRAYLRMFFVLPRA